MMSLGQIVELARQLVEEMGRQGHEVIDERARDHRQKGDAEAAALWSRVAAAMRVLAQ